jgi:hypothetical protein
MRVIPDTLRAMFAARERDLEDGQDFQRNVCQCCGYRKPRQDSPECVCDGLDWYMLPGGSVECAAHKFSRAIGDGKKVFLMGGK